MGEVAERLILAVTASTESHTRAAVEQVALDVANREIAPNEEGAIWPWNDRGWVGRLLTGRSI